MLVETGAGPASAPSDDDYRAAGAEIAARCGAVFAKADMIVKVKEPQPAEWVQLRPGQILFTYLHLAADPAQAQGLMASGVTAVAYETVTDANGHLPLLAPMSEVAGRLSIQAAATALQKPNGGRGVLLGGVPGVPPAKVVVIGGGVVGTQAARMAVGLGANVTDPRPLAAPPARSRRYVRRPRHHPLLDPRGGPEEIASADAVIGAVLMPGAAAPKLVTRAMLADHEAGRRSCRRRHRPGRLLRDLAPDHPRGPTFDVDGVVHYCVANMPGAVPLTSSHALNNATLPFGLALADHGLAALPATRTSANGLNVHHGRITHRAVAESLSSISPIRES